MALSRLQDFEASCRRSFKEHDLIHLEVYTAQEDKVGQVMDILVDEVGHFQYLVVNLTEEMTGKQVLLPYNESEFDQTTRRIYLSRHNRVQVAQLIAYNLTDNNSRTSTFDEVTSCSYPL